MKDYKISFYIEDNTQHIIDSLTTNVNIKATDEDDALEQAEVLYAKQNLPYYSVMEIED